jgi:archaellin
LDATSYGQTTLQPGSNRLTYVAGQAFSVSFTNQGDNDEFNIKVTVTIERASGGSPITMSKTVQRVAKGEKATVTLPLNREPPLDTAVNITTAVATVPGEKTKDNNTSEYPSVFVAG